MVTNKTSPLSSRAALPDPQVQLGDGAASRPLLGLVLGLVGVAIFSGSLPGTRVAVSFFDAGFVTFGRAAFAGLAALATLLIVRCRFPRPRVLPLFLIGLTLVFGFPGFMALAMLTLPSARGGVVLGILPLATALFAALIAGERPSPLFWFCALAGASLVVVFALQDGDVGLQAGDAWLVLAGLTAAAGYVLSGKLTGQMPGWEVISWALVLMLPAALAGTVWFWQDWYVEAPLEPLVAFLYVGLGPMYLGFFAWNAGLHLGGIARVGQVQLLQTFFTLAIAWLILGEAVPYQTWGFALAVLLIILAGRKAQVK